MSARGSIRPQYLLEGAVYALEQCGFLLRDASLLYRNGSYANAFVLAAFAREELGKWRMLLDARSEVMAGNTITFDDLKSRCDDHVKKQRAGVLSTVIRADREAGVGKVIMDLIKAPFSSEWKDKHAQLAKVTEIKTKRLPGDRHQQRMVALYVDPAGSHGEWSRPVIAVSKDKARDFLVDVRNDYAVQHSQHYADIALLKQIDADLAAALEQWEERPELPPPNVLGHPN